MSQTPVIVHHLNNSRSQRILWLLEELEVPYELKTYQRTPEQLAPKELLEVHPLGKSPVITDGDVTLAESGAIVDYLIEKYGQGKIAPTGEAKLTDLYFRHFAEGSFGPLVSNRYIYSLVPERSPFFLRPILRSVFSSLDAKLIDKPLTAALNFIEATFAKNGNWLAGGAEPTGADYMMSFTLEALAARRPEGLGPLTKAWVERIHARPAYKRGLEKGGEYAYARL
ncbi:thioredoxin-like protein [Auriscalpium vulgare]|uniref:Thioredoxin-like protein n=1 Tax=Auriscalpium vulgare TaxID=40419 RepID=A0ACB8RTQ9_9AGAM|nr:thioredoxin-like protein [Auriscalpium vulgare]